MVSGELDGRGYASIRQAHAWADRADAALVVCAVLPRREQWPVRVGMWTTRARSALMHHAGEVAERVAAVTGRPASSIDVRVSVGSRHGALLETAAAVRADLLVMSARSDDLISPHLGVGTVERVVQRARCAVLLAHPSPNNGAVLAATDLEDPALPALRRGAAYARGRSGALTALHWLSGRRWSLAALGSDASRIRERASQALQRALAAAEIEARAMVADGAAAHSIVQEAERIVAELVVVSTPGGSLLSRPRAAMVAEEVARRAPCSVLVVRRRPREQIAALA